MAQLAFDESTARRLEKAYQSADAKRRRRLVLTALEARPGDHVLDVGCGPGFYLAELVETVGPDGRLVGVDSSDSMLSLAARRMAGQDNVEFARATLLCCPSTTKASIAPCAYRCSSTSTMPRRPSPKFAGHCDRRDALFFGTSTGRPSRGTPPNLSGCLESSTPGTTTSHIPRCHKRWRVACAMWGSTTCARKADGISEADADAWAEEQRSLGERGEFFFSCTQFCFSGITPDS